MAFVEDLIDKPSRKLGAAFMRNPGDTVNLGDAANPVRTDPTGTTSQPITAVSLPLPTGASTLAAQTTGNTSLASIDGKLSSLGQKTMALSVPVVLASDQTSIPVAATQSGTWNIGTVTTVTAVTAITNALPAGTNVIGHVITDTGSTTVVTGNVTVVQATGTNLHVVLDTTSTTAVTQATGTNLHAVVDSGTITTVSTVTAVTAITNALPTGANTIGKVDQGTGGASAWKVDGSAVTQPISAVSLPLPTGAATEATLATRLAEATFTGRINTQGQKTMALSTPVVLASDQAAIPVSQSGTWTVTTNAGTNLNTSALALSATQTDGTQRTKITDGTDNVALATATPAGTEQGLVTRPVEIFNSRSDTYTVAANGTTVSVATNPVKYFSVQVKGTGGVASNWDVRLEGSLNNVDFSQILRHRQTDGDGTTIFTGGTGQFPSLYFRSRLVSITLGPATNIVVTILGMD